MSAFNVLQLMPLRDHYREGRRKAPREWKQNSALHELHGCMAVWNITLETLAEAVEGGLERSGDDDLKWSDLPDWIRSQQFDMPGLPPYEIKGGAG